MKTDLFSIMVLLYLHELSFEEIQKRQDRFKFQEKTLKYYIGELFYRGIIEKVNQKYRLSQIGINVLMQGVGLTFLGKI